MRGVPSKFPSPLATALKPSLSDRYCHHCLFAHTETKRCTGCMATRYCSSECQKLDWELGHKFECKTLNAFKTENFLEILAKKLNGEVNASIAVIILRLHALREAGQFSAKKGAATKRTFADLLSHSEEIRRSSAEKMLLFRTIAQFFGSELKLAPSSNPTKALEFSNSLFDIFCKVIINAHSLYAWNNLGESDQIGLALCLDVSAYDHSCAPNADVYTYGRTTYLIPLSDVNTSDPSLTFIPYVNIGAPYMARKSYLEDNYFFQCFCKRCKLALQSCLDDTCGILCEGCKKSTPIGATCQTCNANVSENYQKKCKKLMARLQKSFGTGVPKTGGSTVFENLDQSDLVSLELECSKILPPSNAFYSLLFRRMQMDKNLAEKRLDIWLKYYLGLKQFYPRNSARILLSAAVETCHALEFFGEWKLAQQILEREIMPTVQVYFLRNNCPFQERLQFLRESLVQRLPPRCIWSIK